MVKTIVVPLDGSPLAERAIEPARWLASGFDADLQVFRASFALDCTEDEQYLRRTVVSRGLARSSIEVSTGRSAGPAIVDAAEGAPEGVVCMATRGRTGIGAFLLGSVADEVVHDSTGPVVLVGPCYEPSSSASELLVCTDGSTRSDSIMPLASRWASDLGLATRVLRVDDLDADVASEIVVAAAAEPVALVALATHGRGGVAPTALGSTAARIVSRSPRPVLVHRPAE